MFIRRKLLLENPEDAALRKLATINLRNPDDEARYIIRQELARRGLLTIEQIARTNEERQREQLAAA